ncbi:MAG: methyltransferase domain-containing protein [Betaproteobacteria bacterium]|nr:MAG: methyltransferase domain-containing protein [Betaproteobacteria bacterium]
MAAKGKTTYDDVPYTSLPFAQTHPDRLAALARLFGVEAPSLERCRVLELGCASGGNLIPMALTLPGAEFVGIDLSSVQINDGLAVVAALGLGNVRLSATSITEIDSASGPFDYIIAHGVYSWVPDEVQTRMLDICSRQLAPDGIAFISFNTLPGWRTRGVVRDLMRYHAMQFAEPRARIEQARGMADFLASSVAAANTGYETLVRAEIETLRGQADDYVLHEYLEDTNEPLYFHQFVERAGNHGLQYLADADFGTMLASNFAPEVAQALVRIAPDVIRQEQVMDFLRNRTFRQALLVHESVRVNRKITPDRLRGLGISGSFQVEAAAFDIRSSDVVAFRGVRGNRLRTGNRITKAAVMILNEFWPRSVPFEDVVRRARTMLRDWAAPSIGTDTEAEATLAADMLRCFGAGMVQLHATPSSFSTAPRDRPVASPLARLQARNDMRVTNLRHEPVQIDADLARLIQLLDGTRSREDIERVALEWATANAAASGAPTPGEMERVVKDRVAEALRQFAKLALLV